MDILRHESQVLLSHHCILHRISLLFIPILLYGILNDSLAVQLPAIY